MDGLAVLDGPMRQIAAERPEMLEPIYDDIAELRTLFESDVVSLLDITLGFSDTDGDSG
jgi:predicted lipoprotein